jgi:glycosyltransferase involved in cell wall biosynthesis
MKDGLAEKFLVEYLSQFFYQTHRDFELVFSDQSPGDNLKSIIDTFRYIYDIKYVKNTSGVKNAANNVNNAIPHATGSIVKLLYMDDFFIDPEALAKINRAFAEQSGEWLIAGFGHCDQSRTNYFNFKKPWYGNKYVNGDNTTGNPSNYAVRRESALAMDENLLWIVDGEYFYRSYYHYGDPIMIQDFLVCFRDHGDSAFKRPDLRELDAKERQYCVDKYQSVVEQQLL